MRDLARAATQSQLALCMTHLDANKLKNAVFRKAKLKRSKNTRYLSPIKKLHEFSRVIENCHASTVQ